MDLDLRKRPARRMARVAGPMAAALVLAGCGNNIVDRTLSGGLIGAGGGAAIGAGLGNPAAGAVIGAVSGALVGAVTTGSGSPDLGKPIWR